MVADIGAVVAVLRLRILERSVQHDVFGGPRRLAADDAVLWRDDLMDAAVFGRGRLELAGLNRRRRAEGGFGGAVDDALGGREANPQDAAIDLWFAVG